MKLWIARDFNGSLALYEREPKLVVDHWCASYGREGNFVCLNPDAEMLSMRILRS